MKVKVLLILLSLLAACDKCRYANCPTRYDGLQFSYVSRYGKDLLYGSTKKYDIKDLSVFAFDDQGKKVYSPLAVSVFTDRNSVVDVVLASDRQSFLEVSNAVTDTLKFEFKSEVSDCCGKHDKLTKIWLNRRLMCDDNSRFEIKER